MVLIVIVDCLTLWLTNLLCHTDKSLLEKEKDSLLQSIGTLQSEVIFVSNETNMGVVPMDELSRRFCDEAGLLHQQLGQELDRVVLMVAGLPLHNQGLRHQIRLLPRP